MRIIRLLAFSITDQQTRRERFTLKEGRQSFHNENCYFIKHWRIVLWVQRFIFPFMIISMASKNLTFQLVILRKVEGQTSPFFSVYSSPSIAFFSYMALSKVARGLPSSTKIIAALLNSFLTLPRGFMWYIRERVFLEAGEVGSGGLFWDQSRPVYGLVWSLKKTSLSHKRSSAQMTAGFGPCKDHVWSSGTAEDYSLEVRLCP